MAIGDLGHSVLGLWVVRNSDSCSLLRPPVCNTAVVNDTLSLGMMIYIIVLSILMFLLPFSQLVMKFAPFLFPWVCFFLVFFWGGLFWFCFGFFFEHLEMGSVIKLLG